MFGILFLKRRIPAFLLLGAIFAAFDATASVTPYSKVQHFLNQINQDFPTTTQLFSIGLSDEGLPIEGIAIGSGSLKNLVVATHHGNEYAGTETAKALILDLAKRPIPNQTLYIIPVLNTSGFNRGIRTERLGEDDFDPNRDFPSPCANSHSFFKSSRALTRFVEETGIVSIATLHSYGEIIAHPWGTGRKFGGEPPLDLRDYEVFSKMVEAASKFNNYKTGRIGQRVYPAEGTLTDFFYAEYGVWTILFELGTSHTPSQEELELIVSTNVRGIRLMFEEAAPLERSTSHDFVGVCHKSNEADYFVEDVYTFDVAEGEHLFSVRDQSHSLPALDGFWHKLTDFGVPSVLDRIDRHVEDILSSNYEDFWGYTRLVSRIAAERIESSFYIEDFLYDQHLEIQKKTNVSSEFLASVLIKEGVIKVYFSSGPKESISHSTEVEGKIKEDLSAGFVYHSTIHNHPFRFEDQVKVKGGILLPSEGDIRYFDRSQSNFMWITDGRSSLRLSREDLHVILPQL